MTNLSSRKSIAMASASSDKPGQGPGVFAAIAGPSGAGKDTLMTHARAALAQDSRFAFVRRLITRPPGPDEDCIGVTAEEFADLRSKGGLALSWHAHGLDYGIPASVDMHVANGDTVIANLSRNAIDQARLRYANLKFIYVDAALDIRAARLAARSRESLDDIRERLSRASSFDPRNADLLIINDGDVTAAAERLIDFLRQCALGADQSPASANL